MINLIEVLIVLLSLLSCLLLFLSAIPRQGIQGSLLSSIIEEPVLLSSVVVSQDLRLKDSTTNHQLEALERAIVSRVRAVWDYVASKDDGSSKLPWKDRIPSVHVVQSVFTSGKSALAPSLGAPSASRVEPSQPATGKRIKLSSESSPKPKVSPCGFALNWQCIDPDVVEILIGARGICQGKRPRTLRDFKKLSSRLSRQSLVQQNEGSLSNDVLTYQALKASQSDAHWKLLKDIVLGGGPLSGWLQERNDFSLHGTNAYD